MLATDRALHPLIVGCTPLRRSVVWNSLLELTGAQQVQVLPAARGQQFLSGQQRQGTGNKGFQAGAGYDAHWRDPLAGLQLRTSSYHWMCSQLKSLANELCEGRVVFVLEVRPLQARFCLTSESCVHCVHVAWFIIVQGERIVQSWCLICNMVTPEASCFL